MNCARKIIRANNLLQFIHKVTIEFRFRKSNLLLLVKDLQMYMTCKFTSNGVNLGVISMLLNAIGAVVFIVPL